MILLKDNVLLFSAGWSLTDVKKHCERCGRICYKSENLIKEGSSESFIARLLESKHYSVLEHGTIYLRWDSRGLGKISVFNKLTSKYNENKYSKVNCVQIEEDLHAFITTNYRVIVENGWEDDLQYICAPTEHHEKRYTLWLSVDRGVGEEFLRHRPFSYSKESTRYCRYSQGKFGNQVTNIIPETDFPELMEGQYILNEKSNTIRYIDETRIIENIFPEGTIEHIFLKPLLESEKAYMALIEKGWSAQQARRVLTLAVKGDFVMSGFESDWQHVIDLRYHETTGKVHPDMMHIAEKIVNEFKTNNIIFE